MEVATIQNQSNKGTCSSYLFGNHEVRVHIDSSRNLWFAAKDVADALEITWSGHTLSKIPEGWKLMVKLTTSFGAKDTTFINEAAVYKLAFRSNKEQAERFTEWVASEVLPQIRKTGEYSRKPGLVLAELDSPEAVAVIQAVYDAAMAKKRITVVENEVEHINTRLDRMSGDTGFLTVAAHAKNRSLKIPVDIAKRIGMLASRKCRDFGIIPGRVPDERWGKTNSYPKEIVAEMTEIVLSEANSRCQ